MARGSAQSRPNGRSDGAASVGPEVIGRLADDVLPTLIARLERSQLGELEVRQGGWRVRLRRTAQAADGADKAGPAVTRRTERKADRPTSERPANPAAEGRPQPLHPVDRSAVEVKSPAVGYFVLRDSIVPGSSVRSGDVIGYVDVLGVRQEVVAPEDGTLVALAAEAGQAVEYGEQLARLERRAARPDTAIRVEAEVKA